MAKRNRPKQQQPDKFQTAKEAVTFLDRCASLADLKRQDHIAIQNATDFLESFVAEFEEIENPPIVDDVEPQFLANGEPNPLAGPLPTPEQLEKAVKEIDL